ncbi:MAG: hypothetical protein J6T01_01560 [Kiritimatiellae bacterium]|nr:hypothetical protein [Kiritimatiellia bacterium]
MYDRVRVRIAGYGHVVSRGPVKIGNLSMDNSTGKLNLTGYPLSIVSTEHRGTALDSIGHRNGYWPGSVDYSVAGSTILWGAGFLIFLQ